MQEEEKVFEGRIYDRPKGEVDWRTHNLPTLRTAQAQAAGIEAIRAATHEAVIVNTEMLAEIGVAKVVKFAQYAHHVAQVEPEMADFLREVYGDLKIGVRNEIYRYQNEPR
ncbi:hypothetical protein [Pseudarthrobacter oxydans]|uniref:hypothetical protein n=1 Tax=Pseudarthrobacter oxydans TaxID=1671 RepID=UPI0035E9C388|nr:hypothetical protein GCM10017547_38400 [Pseudarthrobacter oxydans]